MTAKFSKRVGEKWMSSHEMMTTLLQMGRSIAVAFFLVIVGQATGNTIVNGVEITPNDLFTPLARPILTYKPDNSLIPDKQRVYYQRGVSRDSKLFFSNKSTIFWETTAKLVWCLGLFSYIYTYWQAGLSHQVLYRDLLSEFFLLFEEDNLKWIPRRCSYILSNQREDVVKTSTRGRIDILFESLRFESQRCLVPFKGHLIVSSQSWCWDRGTCWLGTEIRIKSPSCHFLATQRMASSNENLNCQVKS